MSQLIWIGEVQLCIKTISWNVNVELNAVPLDGVGGMFYVTFGKTLRVLHSGEMNLVDYEAVGFEFLVRLF